MPSPPHSTIISNITGTNAGKEFHGCPPTFRGQSEAVDQNHQPVKLDVDSEHEFKIVKMNQEEKKVGLSIRAVGEEASRAEVESYKETKSQGGKSGSSSSSSGSSSSTTLGDLLKWKKAENEENN